MNKALTFAILSAAAFAVSTPNSAHADLQKGKALYEQRCVTCHGPQGHGDGPIAASIPEGQKPRNFADRSAFKFAKDDAKFKELLKKGGAAVGLSVLMPPQADLSDADLNSLIEYVNTLGK